MNTIARARDLLNTLDSVIPSLNTEPLRSDLKWITEVLSGALVAFGEPVPMLLFCPSCAKQHVDAPDAEKGWRNPPHRTHLCHSCGHEWRPSDVPTTGVEKLITALTVDNDPNPATVSYKAGYIYVASPMTHPLPQEHAWRIKQATAALDHYTSNDIPAYVPVAINSPIHDRISVNGAWAGLYNHSFWMKIDMAFLAGAKELHVLTLPGWNESHGVTKEIAEFKKTGRPIIYIKPDTYEPYIPAESIHQ